MQWFDQLDNFLIGGIKFMFVVKREVRDPYFYLTLVWVDLMQSWAHGNIGDILEISRYKMCWASCDSCRLGVYKPCIAPHFIFYFKNIMHESFNLFLLKSIIQNMTLWSYDRIRGGTYFSILGLVG